MKIDEKTIINATPFIIGAVFLYVFYVKTEGFKSDCERMYGPQGIDWRGECYKCPQSVLTSGVVAPSEQDMWCVEQGLTKENCTLC